MIPFPVKIKTIVASAAILSGVILFSCSGKDARITSYGILADDLVVSSEKDGPATKPPVFSVGDTIFIRFTLSQFQLDATGNMWIQEDLVMRDENNVSVLAQPNLLNNRVLPPEGATSVPVGNVITLLTTAKPGDYTIDLSVRDKIGGGAVYIEVPVTVVAK